MTDTLHNPEFDFSPSDVHRHLMRNLTPALSYTGGDVGAWQTQLRPRLRQLVGMPDVERNNILRLGCATILRELSTIMA